MSGRLSDPATLRRALTSFAIFRLESALVVALTVILAGSSALGAEWVPGNWWAWLVFGLVAEGAIVITTLTDRRLRRRLHERLFRNRYDPTRLRDPILRKTVSEALDYRRLIDTEIDRRRGQPGPGLNELRSELEVWLERIYRLAQHLDEYRRHPVLTRERGQVPGELDGLRQRLGTESDPAVREQLATALEAKAQQWEALKALRATMERAGLQLDGTLSTLGTVYTRVVNLGTKTLDARQAQHLIGDMHGQVELLGDLEAAMDEVARISKG